MKTSAIFTIKGLDSLLTSIYCYQQGFFDPLISQISPIEIGGLTLVPSLLALRFAVVNHDPCCSNIDNEI